MADRLNLSGFIFAAVLLMVAGGHAAIGGQAPAPQPADAKIGAGQRAAEQFERIRRDPPALRAFLRAFPKGADLHSHLTGAIYPESYIRWAADLALCIDVSSFTYVDAAPGSPVTCRDATQRPAAEALQNPVLYRSVIDALSTRHWNPGRGAGHYQFFDTFLKFDAVLREGGVASSRMLGRGVAEVMHRAALQNVLHLELMLSFDAPAKLPSAVLSWESDAQFETLRERLMANAALAGRVAERRRWLDAIEAEARAALACGTPAAKRGCDMSVRYIANALRGLPPQQVFAQSVEAFELAAADPRIAGVNLVMPEDWYVPMRDYDLHMRMFRFLRTLHPRVNVALHAGELALGLVPPEQLGLHVRHAIEVGGAQRIGHGTDIMHDADAAGLMRDMARRGIAVEISLSSSDVILGIRGDRHPLRQYLRAGVPVVIATDDEGVARSDLTNEYQRAVEEHGLSYQQLKAISRNSIEHSFVSPQEKARLRANLAAAFDRFESGLVGSLRRK